VDHTSPEIRDLFLRGHELWGTGSFADFIQMMHEDILYIVNVDGQQVPYAMSAVGREDLRDRFELLLRTFNVTHFELLSIYPEIQHITSHVHGIYHHKATREILDVKVRFRAWFDTDRMITRLEEIHDARYVEAFERFVFFIESASKEG
jgi:hypothetical protein